MPGLVACGRRWDIGSDDLVFPGVGSILVRLVWLIVIALVFHFHRDGFACPSGHLVQAYYIGMLVLLAVHILWDIIIVYTSMQGTITEASPRRSIPILIYIKMVLFFPEAVWVVLGTYWGFSGTTNCEVHIVWTVKVAVLCAWFLFFLLLIGLLIVFDPAGKLHASKVLPVSSKGGLEADHGTRVAAMKVWENRCKLLCCCAACDEQSKNAFNDVARLMATFFEGLDLVASDIAAGLILVQVEQDHEPRTHTFVPLGAHNKPVSTASGNTNIPHTSAPHHMDSLAAENRALVTGDESDSEHAILHVSSTQSNSADRPCEIQSSHEDVFPCPKPWMDIHHVAHYMKFAMASYGWPLYMYSNLLTGCCKLYRDCRCASCMYQRGAVEDDNCCECHTAAIKMAAGIQDEDIVYASFYNRIYQIPFFVAMDHQEQAVVIGVRGSLSLRDALTDMTADCEDFDEVGVDCATVHRGMNHAARYIRDKLRQEQILESAFSRGPGYKLVLTGHSLGAGASSILSLMLRKDYPDLVCYAYSPPGGLLSLPLSRYTEEFICSVVLGKDLVPRLSLAGMEELKSQVCRVIKDCKKPKYKILAGGCWYVLCGLPNVEDSNTSSPRRHLLGSRNTITSPLQYTGGHSELEESLEEAIAVSGRSRISYPLMYPPGQIMYIEEAESRKSCMEDPVYEAAWARAETFREIVVSPRMVVDHFPDVVMKALQQLSDRHHNPKYVVKENKPDI